MIRMTAPGFVMLFLSVARPLLRFYLLLFLLSLRVLGLFLSITATGLPAALLLLLT